MILWILTIATINGQTEYGYKFIEKANCEKVGQQITGVFKKTAYSCKRKRFPIDTENK